MKIIVVGSPRSGKSTYAIKSGLTHYCTDPKSLVKEPTERTIYMPETLPWGDDSSFVVSRWFTKPGDWIIEGVGTVRALRKWVARYPNVMPCDKIVVFHGHHPKAIVSDGQRNMGKGIMNIWGEIASYFNSITEHIQQ